MKDEIIKKQPKDGAKECQSAEEINPDFDYEYDRMTLAQKKLTDYSDGHYTQFPGYENILMAMQEYAEQYHNSKTREKLIKFAEYLTNSNFPYSICHGEIEPFVTNDDDFDCEYIVNEFLNQ